jgi:riboflavin kinase / FMN adenylyltransferase
MEVLRGIGSLPLVGPETAVTIGFFDGVHRGHQAVFGRTVDVARDRGLISVGVTFDRHPREVYAPGTEPKLLTTLERKASLIDALGIDVLLVLEFDEDFSKWTPEEFVKKVLVDGLNARHAVIGSNFTFGYKAMGNLVVLTELGAASGFSVEGVALLKLEGRAVSSSSIREALAGADLAWPTEALGRRYVVEGVVGNGAGRGAGLGYPTANLDVPPRILLPAEGVYAGRAVLEDGSGQVAAINVGTNPTFGGEPLHVEAFLLDFEGDLRGRRLGIEFWERLRDETRFGSAGELARQIEDDVARTRLIVR